jgi:hypothetical protein
MQVTKEVQQVTLEVSAENAKLRSLLARLGVPEAEVKEFKIPTESFGPQKNVPAPSTIPPYQPIPVSRVMHVKSRSMGARPAEDAVDIERERKTHYQSLSLHAISQIPIPLRPEPYPLHQIAPQAQIRAASQPLNDPLPSLSDNSIPLDETWLIDSFFELSHESNDGGHFSKNS